MKQELNEGLRPRDLSKMVYPIFEVDVYASKMGEDRDVCVLSFQVKDRSPAKDMMEFIEKNYTFVLDSDISSGENKDGEYFVFVEVKRSGQLAEHIKDIVYGVGKLTGLKEFQFKYHKTPSLFSVTTEALTETIPDSPNTYDIAMGAIKTEEIKSFFNKTLMDGFELNNDIVTIHKRFGSSVNLKIVSKDANDAILEDTGAIALDEETMSEIFWLSKVVGDYNISKIGENLLFTNGNRSMILQRVD